MKNQLRIQANGKDFTWPSAFEDVKFKDHVSQIRRLKLKVWRERMDSRPFYGRSKHVTDNDLLAIAALCYWNGNGTNAEFLHLIMSMSYNCGRGSEVCIHFFLHLYIFLSFVANLIVFFIKDCHLTMGVTDHDKNS